MTKGEYRVGINFNPSNDDTVGRIKRLAADLIDLIESIYEPTPEHEMTDEEWMYLSDHSSEISRLKGLAQDNVEGAAMWAVKAATKGPWV